MSPTYAKETDVPEERSRAEIERTLQRYGASACMYGWNETQVLIGFELQGRRYRMTLPLPTIKSYEILYTPTRRILRSPGEQKMALQKAIRQRWRALSLWIKAMLEANESGIVTLEQAMQAYLVLPDGRTAGEWLQPQIEHIYHTGRMPPLLPGLPAPDGEVIG